MQTVAFLQRHFPLRGTTILDVGAGRGRLLPELERAEALVFAIDKSERSISLARAEGRTVHKADICSLTMEDRFDAALFSMSAHHVHPLEKALAQTEKLLNPEGHVVIDDFAVEECDRDSARWYYETLTTLAATGLVERPAWELKDDPLELWWKDHAGTKHRFNTGQEILSLIEEKFDLVTVERVPYFYRYLSKPVPAAQERFYAIERELIGLRRVRPLGLRIVARKRAPAAQ